MTRENTREKILDAAEELFSEGGFSATSIRAITTRAGVNLAALNYHFGTKDGVIDAVLSRRIEPLNKERIRLLEQFERESGDTHPALEKILAAFLGPAIHLAVHQESGGKKFMRLMGRVLSEPNEFLKKVISKHFRELTHRFERAFRLALPDIKAEEVFWRLHFVIGSMAHTMAHSLTPEFIEILKERGSESAGTISDAFIPSMDADRVLNYLIHFSAAGLRAESLEADPKEGTES